MAWQKKKYGRLTGGELLACLRIFRACWAERVDWPPNEDQWVKSVEKLMTVPNWTPLYQHSLAQLVTLVASITGTLGAIEDAANSESVALEALRVFEGLPDEPPDHPAAMPIAFAMIGNLDAIARYSRSVSDMLRACTEKGDVQALFDALSVDSMISTMPFFQAALRLGQLSGDASAAKNVFRAIEGPHRKRLIYPELRWTEYLLRDQGAFEVCSREDIYELIVVHLGIYDASGEKQDPKAALFTLFRAWQKEAGIQNPRFGFSAKRE